eukprot:1186752-Prorocentrum_minimum.AAC.3
MHSTPQNRAGYIPGGAANHTTGQGLYPEGEPITPQGRVYTWSPRCAARGRTWGPPSAPASISGAPGPPSPPPPGGHLRGRAARRARPAAADQSECPAAPPGASHWSAGWTARRIPRCPPPPCPCPPPSPAGTPPPGQSQGGREHIPDAGANHRGEESIFLVCFIASFTNDSDVQDSHTLGSVWST